MYNRNGHLQDIRYTALLLMLVLLDVWQCEAIRCGQDAATAEGRLKKKLLCHIDKGAIPLPDGKVPRLLDMSLLFETKQFMVSDTLDVLTLNLNVVMQWHVPSLSWDPVQNDNLTRLIVMRSSIWTPAFTATHSQNIYVPKKLQTAKYCVLAANGTITCTTPHVQRLGCDGSDRTAWPYNRLNCSVRITSDELLIDQMSLNSDFRVTTEHSQDMLWRMAEFGVQQYDNGSVFSCSVVRWTVNHDLLFNGPIIVVVLNNLLSLMMVPSSRDRIGVNAFTVLVNLQIVVAIWQMPETGDTVPLIFKYTMLSLLTSTVLLLNTILMRYLYECRKPVTQTLRSIVSLLSIVTLGGHFSATGYFVEKRLTPFAFKDVTVESQIRVDRAANAREDWQRLAAAIDRCLIVMLIIWYAIIAYQYLPRFNASAELTQ